MRRLVVIAAAMMLWAAPAPAHDIPASAIVRMFVKPQGHTLRLVVRMPLKSLPDAEYPRRERDFVDLAKVEPFLRDAARLGLLSSMDVYEDGRLLPAPRITAVRMSLDADASFSSYARALAHVTGPPLNPAETIYWEQGLLDVVLDYPIQSDRARFSMHAAFDRLALREVTTVQFLPPDGLDRAYELEGDAGLVQLDPSWLNAAVRFVVMGFNHILEGTDHLLFLLCLVLPFRRLLPLVGVVSAFTIAHSLTLFASAYNLAPDALWFPPLIEVLIALSIFYMALENIVVLRPAHRWIITFCFGLVHGFGFSFGLRHALQFAGSHLLTSLFSFNVGVELGQILVLLLAVPALNLLFRRVVPGRLGLIILSVIVAHQAWHWMQDRFDLLRQFAWPRPTWDDAPALVQWAMAGVALAALLWLTARVVAMLAARREASGGTPP